MPFDARSAQAIAAALNRARTKARKVLVEEYPERYEELVTEQMQAVGYQEEETTIVKTRWVKGE